VKAELRVAFLKASFENCITILRRRLEGFEQVSCQHRETLKSCL
jgi:hypothetical protein